jgi:hypothetical protein
MNLFEIISKDSFTNIINERLSTINARNLMWKDSPFSEYVKLDNKQRGSVSEVLMKEFLSEIGLSVERRSSTDNDCIVGKYKTELKFALESTRKYTKQGKMLHGSFTINHISVSKDWNRLICAFVTPENYNIYWMTKAQFIRHKDNRMLFNKQQAGNKNDNDDYMFGGSQYGNLVAKNILKDITKWK